MSDEARKEAPAPKKAQKYKLKFDCNVGGKIMKAGDEVEFHDYQIKRHEEFAASMSKESKE